MCNLARQELTLGSHCFLVKVWSSLWKSTGSGWGVVAGGGKGVGRSRYDLILEAMGKDSTGSLEERCA